MNYIVISIKFRYILNIYIIFFDFQTDNNLNKTDKNRINKNSKKQSK